MSISVNLYSFYITVMISCVENENGLQLILIEKKELFYVIAVSAINSKPY